MEPWQFYSMLTAQLLTGLIPLFLAYLIYKRNPEYKGNLFLSIGFLFYSLYPFGCFFYELGINEQVVQVSIRISYLGSILGAAFFLISMNIFCLGSQSEKIKKLLIPHSIFTTLVCIIIFLPSSITSIELNPTSAVRSMILVGAISSYIFLVTGRNIYLLTKTINEIKDKDLQIIMKLRNFRLALIISFGIMVFSIIENFTQIHFFNIFNYFFLLLTYIYISRPLLKKEKIETDHQ